MSSNPLTMLSQQHLLIVAAIALSFTFLGFVLWSLTLEGVEKPWTPARGRNPDQVPRETKAAVFTMAGSPKSANKLLENIRKLNPKKPEQWVYEKAIEVLQREMKR